VRPSVDRARRGVDDIARRLGATHDAPTPEAVTEDGAARIAELLLLRWWDA